MEKSTSVKYGTGVAVLIAVFLLSFGAGYQYKEMVQVGIDFEKQLVAPVSASLMIDYGNGVVKTYQDIPVTASTTAFTVLKSASERNDFALGYKDFGGDLGVFIETINNVGKDPVGKKWWQYWVNNQYGLVGTSNYKIKPGDVIEFKFIDGQE